MLLVGAIISRGLFLATLRSLAGSWIARAVLLYWCDRLGAFDLMLKLIAMQRGVFFRVARMPDLPIFFDRLLALQHGGLYDRTGKWVDLRHRSRLVRYRLDDDDKKQESC